VETFFEGDEMTAIDMTAAQQVKLLILNKSASWRDAPKIEATSEDIDEIYDFACENDDGDLHDSRSEVRYGEFDTNIESPFSRHYESKSVAAKTPDGRWVGWTYWYGGGKHGEPEAIDWIDDAYYLDCKEEEKTVIVRTFSKQ
jgi:hypothetical protein